MQIKFTRSGGFAGTATNVEGVVDFSGDGAQVNSNSAKYDRKLTSQEAEQLQTAAETASTASAKTASGAGSSPIRDGYQYDVTVTNKDGKTRALTIGGEGAHSPETAELAAWIQQEAQKIWTHKIGNR